MNKASLLESIYLVLGPLLFLSFILALVGFYLMKFGKSKSSTLYGPLLFGQVFFLGFLIGIIKTSMESEYRDMTVNFLSRKEINIKLDGKNFFSERKDSIITQIANMKSTPAHHSSPIDERGVVLTSGTDSMELQLFRDSNKKGEYWVFYRGYEIGRYHTE
ncbi:hypothetical protein ACFST9_02225 [Hymenobacter monticola]|uniref:Uncharacterized protein n=1 Tax=Hymenobacter monticola TaxID=1705399 RepID=A0ABY4B5D7_9BACT|nr:hypothetical protein [Hymenobacter monticola]UOE33221.1 hypothetical protein MTP16_19105 [Hymenobacter monticola]